MIRFILLLSIIINLFSCHSQVTDPSSLSPERVPADKFEPWDPDLITAPGAHLITFTEGDTVTTYPYYNKATSHIIKFKVNTGALPAGAVDPGVYTAKLEYSSDNGVNWLAISGADNIPVTAGSIISYDWTIPVGAPDTDQYLIRVTATAISNQSISDQSSKPFIVDTTPPNITELKLTAGSLGVVTVTPSVINRSFFGFSVKANDLLSPLYSYCLKTDGTTVTPNSDDDCWVNFTNKTNKTIDLTNVPGFVGFVAGVYDLRIWVKDAATNVSVLTGGTGTQGVDWINLGYNPAVAPVLSNVIISNDDSTSLSPDSSKMIFTAGQNVFVRWKVLDSDLQTNPMTVLYTTDESTFTEVTALKNITNSAHSCTIDANYTGCAVFPAPSAGYFRVQIKAIDQTGLISTGGSNAGNLQNLRMLVGNTDLGLNGSANNAVFLNRAALSDVRTDTNIIAVDKKGRIYYLDRDRGILFVDPADGTQKIFIPKSTVSSGDGDLYNLATTSNTYKIQLDYQDRLIILEKYRIRRVEADGTINTIIGGGDQAYDPMTKTSIDATKFKMDLQLSGSSVDTTYYLFQPLPNGDIWFSLKNTNSGNLSTPESNLLGIYRLSTGRVYFLAPAGVGVYGNPTLDMTDGTYFIRGTVGLTFDFRTSQTKYLTTHICKSVPGGCWFYSANYNPRTGLNAGYGTQYPVFGSGWGANSFVISRRGDLYVVAKKWNPGLYRFNTSNLTWDRILGTGSGEDTGFCPDDTLATACKIDIADAYITENKTIYFVDRGGVVRVILPNGRVKSLFGQNFSFGDGGAPASARLGKVDWLGVWGADNKIVVADYGEKLIREATLGPSGSIYKLCGDGGSGSILTSTELISSSTAENRTCFNGYWGVSGLGMAVDKRNGEVYTTDGSAVGKLLRSGGDAGKWQRILGSYSGSTPTKYCFQHSESSNQIGTNVNSCTKITGAGGYPFSIFGILNPDTMTTSSSLGAVENGSSAAHILVATQVWDGSKLREPYYKSVNGDTALVRHISGTESSLYDGNLEPTVGADFSTSIKKPIYNNYSNAIYVQEDRSVLFTQYHQSYIIRTPVSRGALDVITGAGLVGQKYSGIAHAYKSINYQWASGNINYIYYCGADGLLYRYKVADATVKNCPFPTSSTGANMFTCAGRTLLWDATKTNLIFPISQNGITAIAQYNVGGCN